METRRNYFYRQATWVSPCIIAMMVVPGLISTKAHAAETYTAHETSMINTVNTIWTLVAAFLVFGMQAGFVMLEAGFARKKETVNILMECIYDTCLCGILFWAVGYAFMFGNGNGFIGWGGADGKNGSFYKIPLLLMAAPVSLYLRTGYSSMHLPIPAQPLYQAQ